MKPSLSAATTHEINNKVQGVHFQIDMILTKDVLREAKNKSLSQMVKSQVIMTKIKLDFFSELL